MSPDLCEVVSAVSIGEADARIIDLINVYIACAMDDLCWTNQYADMRYAGSLRILVQLDWRSRTSHSSPKATVWPAQRHGMAPRARELRGND